MRFTRVLPLILAVILFFYYTSFYANHVPVDSDYASLVLEASEMLHGNFFHNGWILSGVSFTFTDLPYFWIGVLLQGTTVGAYCSAAGLMLIALVITGWLLAKESAEHLDWQNRLLALLAFAWICAVPNPYWQSITRAHSGSIVWAFLSLYALNRYLRHNIGKSLYLALFFIVLSCWGDSVSLLAIITPCVFVLFWKAAKTYEEPSNRMRLMRVALLVCGAAAVGIFFDSLYFLIGGADKNSFLNGVTFVGMDEWGDKLTIYLQSLFGMLGGNFTHEPLFSFVTIWHCIRAFLVPLTFVLVVRHIRRLFLAQHDFICSVLCLGFIFISVIFVLTTLSVNVNSARYMAYFPVFAATLFVRTAFGDAKSSPGTLPRTQFAMAAALLLALIGVSVSTNGPSSAINGSAPNHNALLATLDEEDLTQGYCDFWTGQSVNLASKGRVSLKAVQFDGSGCTIFKWICKSKWYQEPAYFVVVNSDTGPRFNFSDEAIIASFGEPIRIVDNGDTPYKIYIYDYDLSSKLH